VPYQLIVGGLIVLIAIAMMSVSTLDLSEQSTIGIVVAYLALLANGLRGEAAMCWCAGSLLATALGLGEILFESDHEAAQKASRVDVPIALACQGAAFFLAGVGIASQPVQSYVLAATFGGDILLMLLSNLARYELTRQEGYLLAVPLTSSLPLAVGGLAVCCYRQCPGSGWMLPGKDPAPPLLQSREWRSELAGRALM
jgi:hypothetical protein